MNETAAQRMFEARTERRAKTPTGYEVILRCIASAEPEQVAAAEGSEGNAADDGRLAALGQRSGNAGLEQ